MAESGQARGRVLAGMAVVPNAGRIALAVSAVSATFSALLLITRWTAYTNPWVAVVAWVVAPAVVVGGVTVGTRRGGTSPPAFMAVCVTLLYGVDLLVMAVLPPADRYGLAAWNWGAVATALLALSPYRPSREVVVAAVGHAGIGAAAMTVAHSGVPIDGVAIVLLVSGCVIPVFAAAHYLRLYAAVLEIRREVAARRLSAEARTAAETAIRHDSTVRLNALREQLGPLFAAVADGAPLPLDRATAERARDLADAVRAELVESSTGAWLLGAELTAAGRAAPVEVVGSLEGLGRDDTTNLVALVGLLRGFAGWRSVRITVGGSAVVAVVVTAAGPAAGVAAADLSVRAAAADLCGEVRLAPPDVLFVEARRPNRRNRGVPGSERHSNG